jgi:hypothetical protein
MEYRTPVKLLRMAADDLDARAEAQGTGQPLAFHYVPA